MISSWNGTTSTSSIKANRMPRPAEGQTGLGVAGKHPEDDGGQDDPAGEDAGVGQRTQKVQARVDLRVVVQGHTMGGDDPGYLGVALCLKRADDHVVEGEQEDDGPDDEGDRTWPAADP